MQCPKCGNENLDDATVCGSCGFVVPKPNEQWPKPRAKMGKTIVGAVLLAGLSLVMVICVKPTLAFSAAVFGLILSILSIIQAVRGRRVPRLDLGSAFGTMISESIIHAAYLPDHPGGEGWAQVDVVVVLRHGKLPLKMTYSRIPMLPVDHVRPSFSAHHSWTTTSPSAFSSAS